MSITYEAAKAEAERLSRLSEARLLQELGLRAEDRIRDENGDDRAGSFEGAFAAREPAMSGGRLEEIGRRWWGKLRNELMKVLCDPSNDDVKKLTGNKSVPDVAAALAVLAVGATVASPPAWVIVGATLIAKKVVQSGVESICEIWAEDVAG